MERAGDIWGRNDDAKRFARSYVHRPGNSPVQPRPDTSVHRFFAGRNVSPITLASNFTPPFQWHLYAGMSLLYTEHSRVWGPHAHQYTTMPLKGPITLHMRTRPWTSGCTWLAVAGTACQNGKICPPTVASVHRWQGLSVTKEAWKDNRFLTLPHGFFTSESKHVRPVDQRFHYATTP